MKIVNIVLGIATAIILGALINLGIKAFYPEPVAPMYPIYAPSTPAIVPCPSNDQQCLQQNAQIEAQEQAQQDQFNKDEQAYTDAMKVYNRNLFIIANVIGVIVFAVGFRLIFGALVSSIGVPIGIMLAGLWSIVYGYGRGWDSIDDKLKFVVGLVVAVVVIGGSMWLIQRRDRAGAKAK